MKRKSFILCLLIAFSLAVAIGTFSFIIRNSVFAQEAIPGPDPGSTEQPLSLTIRQNTIDGNGEFEYRVNGISTSIITRPTTGNPNTGSGSVSLDLGSGTESREYNITVFPNPGSGWNMMAANCVINSNWTWFPLKSTGTITSNGISNVEVMPGHNTVCTFTHKAEPGFFKIIKESYRGNGSWGFDFLYDYNQMFSWLPVGSGIITTEENANEGRGEGSYNSPGLPPGLNYAVSESALAVEGQWALYDAYCNDSSSQFIASSPLQSGGIVMWIPLLAGKTRECTFKNIRTDIANIGTLKVVKNAPLPQGIGPIVSRSFDYQIRGAMDVNGRINSFPSSNNYEGSFRTSLSAGEYSITELEANDWTPKGVTCQTQDGVVHGNLFGYSGNDNSNSNHGIRNVRIEEGKETTCRFDNEYDLPLSLSPNLTIQKTNTTQSGDATFEYNVAGQTSRTLAITTRNGAGSVSAEIAVPEGQTSATYSITEIFPNEPGWRVDSARCELKDRNGSLLNVWQASSGSSNVVSGVEIWTAGNANGYHTFCYFTNSRTPQSTITITKSLYGGTNSVIFNFFANGSQISSLNINPGSSVSSGPISITPNNNYTITESSSAVGWTLTPASYCWNPNYNGGTYWFAAENTLIDGMSGVVIRDGDRVECEFFNFYPSGQGTLQIRKTLEAPQGTLATSVDFYKNNDSNLFSSISSAELSPLGTTATTSINLTPATYTIREGFPDPTNNQWAIKSVSCKILGVGGSIDELLNINITGLTVSGVEVRSGRTTVCDFVNAPPTKPSAITITKFLQGGTTSKTFNFYASDYYLFPINVLPDSSASQFVNAPIPEGLYRINEDPPIGGESWTFDFAYCVNDLGNDNPGDDIFYYDDGSYGVPVYISPGDRVECEFFNFYPVSPNLTIQKTNTTQSGDATFEYNVAGQTSRTLAITTRNGAGSVSAEIAVPEGQTSATYSITEIFPNEPGWRVDSARCELKDRNGSLLNVWQASSGSSNVVSGVEIWTAGNANGYHTFCYFTNSRTPPPGTSILRIVKRVTNYTSGLTETFKYSFQNITQDAQLISDKNIEVAGASSEIQIPINLGNLQSARYVITEEIPEEWLFNSVACTNQSGTVSSSTPSVTATVYSEDITTCTFTNTYDDELPSPTCPCVEEDDEEGIENWPEGCGSEPDICQEAPPPGLIVAACTTPTSVGQGSGAGDIKNYCSTPNNPNCPWAIENRDNYALGIYTANEKGENCSCAILGVSVYDIPNQLFMREGKIIFRTYVIPTPP